MHERETQLAVYDTGSSLPIWGRLPTKQLTEFISSLSAEEKHVAVESYGIHPPDIRCPLEDRLDARYL